MHRDELFRGTTLISENNTFSKRLTDNQTLDPAYILKHSLLRNVQKRHTLLPISHKISFRYAAPVGNSIPAFS